MVNNVNQKFLLFYLSTWPFFSMGLLSLRLVGANALAIELSLGVHCV